MDILEYEDIFARQCEPCQVCDLDRRVEHDRLQPPNLESDFTSRVSETKFEMQIIRDNRGLFIPLRQDALLDNDVFQVDRGDLRAIVTKAV